MERLRRTRDCGAAAVARHLPLRIKYWVTLQEISYATRTSSNVPATPVHEVLTNLRAPKSMA